MPEVSQVVLLPRGRYKVSGMLRGSVIAKRGLVWEVSCASGARQRLGATPPLLGTSRSWREFSFEIVLDANGGECTGQTLRLRHDARSASEEFISGEVWFDNITITRQNSEVEQAQ